MRSVEGTHASSCGRFRPLELSPTTRSSAASADGRIRLPTLPLLSTASTTSPQCEINTAHEPIDKMGEWISRSPLIYKTHYAWSIITFHCHQTYLLGWKGLGTRLASGRTVLLIRSQSILHCLLEIDLVKESHQV